MTNHVQCDLHRRNDEAARCRVANAAAKQSKLNRAEWIRRAYNEPNPVIRNNIMARVVEHDLHGWKH